MFKLYFSILCTVVFLAGCSIYKIDSQDSTLNFYPPKTSVDQVVYLDKVGKPHEIIGIVTATTDRTRPLQEVVDKMRQEAAILGGDAIIDISSDDFSLTGKKEIKKFLQGDSILVHYSAKVIVFK